MSKNNMRSFVLLFIGQMISQLGSAMTSFATIIWVYSESGRVLASSMLAICSALPYLIVSMFGGAVADRKSKKKIMIICDTVAAIGSIVILICFLRNHLYIGVLCAVNAVNGFMNAFQQPASKVAVSLLIPRNKYTQIEAIQSFVNSILNILKPVLAAMLLGIGGLGLVLCVDLISFLFAVLTLIFFVKIPEVIKNNEETSFAQLITSMLDSLLFLKKEKGLFLLLVFYGVLNFVGAISFDSMYSPLILARTKNNEMILGIVSAAMALGSMTSSIALTFIKEAKNKISAMLVGSTLCLVGIMLFGMGQNLFWWCAVAFCGCFGMPIYYTYQTVLLREKIPISMQGRIFSLQGMLTQMLSPIGYFLGAILADYVFEPFMQKDGILQSYFSYLVGKGDGAGIGLIFVIAGGLGIVVLMIINKNENIRKLDVQK